MKGCSFKRNKISDKTVSDNKRLLSEWINKRQDLLKKYFSSLSLAYPTSLLAKKARQALCQSLIDYLALGHFKVYVVLIQQNYYQLSHNKELLNFIISQLYNNMFQCLSFNDTEKNCMSKNQLKHVVADLGIKLEERFVLEDNMLKLLKSSDRSMGYL